MSPHKPTEGCEHKKALEKSGITLPEGYICRACHPSEGCCEECHVDHSKCCDRTIACEDKNCLCHVIKATEKTLDQYSKTFKDLAEYDKEDHPHQDWRSEFDEKFNFPHWKETGYNLNHVKSFIESVEKKAKQDTLAEVIERVKRQKIQGVNDNKGKNIKPLL